MAEKPKDKEEARFNEALKRMLKTPPKPKEKAITHKESKADNSPKTHRD